MSDIRSLTEMLRLRNCSDADIKRAIKELKEYDITLLSKQRLEIAYLYYEILKQIQNLYFDKNEKIPEEMANDVRLLFENIQGICSEATMRERQETAFSVILFLAYLRGHNCITGDNDFSKTEDAIKMVNDLKADLGAIQFVFDWKVNGQLYFPIENMLVSVINDEQFVDEMSNIDSGHIKVLYLAVHFFDEEEQKKQILTDIVEKCHLQFIEYMQERSELLDTMELHNYRKNGVITFINFKKRKILIRHNNEKYFSGAKNIQKEISYNNDRVIGYYVEQDIPEGAVSVTFRDIMLNSPEKRMELLRLFYSGYRNIFGEYYLLEQNGNIFPVNSFAYRDQYIINGTCEVTYDNARDLLEEYGNLSAKRSLKYVLNRLTVGTITQLIEIEDVINKKIFEIEYNEDDFYQNQLIRNWLINVQDKTHAISKLFDTMYMELKYCISRKTSENEDEISVEKHRVCNQKYLPFYMELSQLLYMVEDNLKGKKATVQEATVITNQSGAREVIILEGDAVLRVKESKVNTVHLKFDELDMNKPCYLILDEERRVYLEDQRISKALYGLQGVMKNCLSYDTIKEVDMISYNKIKQGVELHRKGLSEIIPENVFPKDCFEEQFYYRLIHNMIYSNIQTYNINDYLKIFKGHQLLDFCNIKKDTAFQMADENSLYVPKDSYGEDSTLGNIYSKYLKKEATRDNFGLYQPQITYNSLQQKYLQKNKPIQHIVFLSDNFERGAGTIVMLSAYLNMPHTNQNLVNYAKTRIQTYSYRDENNQEYCMELRDVIEKNQCDITVHAYYGTDEACRSIREFLENQGYDNDRVHVTYEYLITCKMKQIKESVKAIWGGYKDENDEKFAVIREFNMTKANVFPREMIKYPERAIDLYLLKEENKNKYQEKANHNLQADNLLGIEGMKRYFQKNGIKNNNQRTNTELYIFSTLPPAMRIEVLEDYLRQDNNILVLDKLVKAYGKAGRLEELKERLADWIEKKYIDNTTAETFWENAEILNRYAEKFPIAKNMEQARNNFKKAMSAISTPVDKEFIEIMKSILRG